MTADVDLVIVGGGPAGCAAAVMAASLGMQSVLIEPDALCRKLYSVTATVNVLGGFASGTELAERIMADVARATRCEVLLGRGATAVQVRDDHVHVALDGGDICRAPYAVIATGVRPQTTAEADWITQDRPTSLQALWEAEAAELTGGELLVLGIDRPLGTVLRTHPGRDIRVLVLYAAAEQYKAAEVATDERVVLLPTKQLELFHDAGGTTHVRAVADDGAQRTFVGERLYVNLGSRPVVPDGDLITNMSGYCPPEQQPGRLLVAGDLRGARNQRIMTAFGSGAEAALTAYYAINRVG